MQVNTAQDSLPELIASDDEEVAIGPGQVILGDWQQLPVMEQQQRGCSHVSLLLFITFTADE